MNGATLRNSRPVAALLELARAAAERFARLEKRTRLLVAAGAAVLVVAAALFVWLGTGKAKAAYRTARPKRGEITATVTSTGNIAPVISVQVGTPVSGIIKALYVDYNSPVQKNQPIAQIDPATFKAQVDQTLGNYLAAQANLAKARVTVADTARTRARYEKLLKEGTVSVSDTDNAVTAHESAKAALKAAEGSVSQAKGAYDQARTNLEYTTIRSPVDVIVISRAVDVGQTVAASLQAPTLFTIAQDLTKMEIDVSVDEADIGKIKEGGLAFFSVDAYPDARFEGRVVQVRNAPVTVQNVVTYVVVVGVDNKDLRLKPGMTANVTFVAAKKDDALKIPTAALRFRPKDDESAERDKTPARGSLSGPVEKRIYVLSGGRPKPVAIVTGIGNDRETEVLSGDLPEDAEVVIEQASAAKKGPQAGAQPLRGF